MLNLDTCDGFAAAWPKKLLVGLALQLACLGTVSAQDLSQEDLARLLARKSAAMASANAVADSRLVDKLGLVGRGDAAWPVYTFLRAELLLQMQRMKPADEAYRSLVEHAASNPYKDTWGGHGLSAFALYRWLQLRATAGSTERAPFEQMADWADSVLDTRLMRSAFRQYAILSSMPLLEEQLYHGLALEALRVGSSKRAGAYFLAYLSRVRSAGIAPESDPLYRVVVEQGISTPDRIALLRGKRRVALNQTTAALPDLQLAGRSTHDQTRLEALYLQARATGSTMSRAAKSAIFQEVHRYATNDELAQSALLHDGLLFGHEEPEFIRTLTRVVDKYPGGPISDEALRWLARGARITGDLDGALAWYGKVHRQSPYLSRVAIDTALAFIWRGRPTDFDVASGVLKGLLKHQPHTNDRSRALFWLGRIAEQTGRPDASKHFEEAAEAGWFDYYGLRARMHLASGGAARSHLLIESPALADKVRNAYAVAAADAPLPTGLTGIYNRRLHSALGSGVYQRALAGEEELRRVDGSKRVQEMTFEELDKLGFLAPIAVMIALRQDALAAVDANPSIPGRLALARKLGEASADWPALLSLVHPVSVNPAARRAELMRAPGYLRVAYPMVFEAPLREATAKYRVAPALLYAVMRQESFFYTAALSPARALGLFQFIPTTFEDLNRNWGLLANSGSAAPDRVAYLMNERLSIPLGARWFAQKLLRFDNNPLLAALAHHSGEGSVNKWRTVWKERGWIDDVETMIESFRMHDIIPERSENWGIEARQFARNVITDIAIVEALRLYMNSPK